MFALAVIIAALACSVSASETAPTVTLTAQNMPLDEAVGELVKQSGARIFLDPLASGSITASFNKLPLEQALDVIAKSNNLKWQKIHAADYPEAKSALEQVKTQAAALLALSSLPMAVYDPDAKVQIVFLRQQIGEQTPPSLSPESFSLKPFYLISLPKSPEKPKEPTSESGTDYATLQRQRFEAFLKLSPEERQVAFRGEMEQEMALPENVRREIVRDRVQALHGMDRDALREYMRTWGEAFREIHEREGRPN